MRPRRCSHLLATLQGPLTVTIHLAPEDPRYVDVQRAVFAKLARVLPDLTILIAVLGLLWAFFDEERLTWHDLISKTFPTADGR